MKVLPHLIEALREELKHYGEMLALLDQQQGCVLNRQAEELVQSVVAIQKEAVILQSMRGDREKRKQEAARELSLTETSSFAEIISGMPAEYQPQIRSLVEENNALLSQVHWRAHQNHLVLSRSLELMQQFLGTLFPHSDPQVYGEHGLRLAAHLRAPPMYDAVG